MIGDCKFIRGCFRLQFEKYSNDKYAELVESKWSELDKFFTANAISGEIYDTDEPKVYFEYRVARPTIKECRALRTLIKAKLKEVYGVKIEETICAEGSCY